MVLSLGDKLLSRSTLKIGLEMIDFQNDTFGRDLEKVLTTIQGNVLGNKYKDSVDLEGSKEVKELLDLVFDRLGINSIIVSDSTAAAVMPFYANKNHVFLDNYWRGNFTLKDQEKLLRVSNGKKGYVNNDKATLGGIFSEYQHTVYMNFDDLFGTLKLSPAEVTAVYLHELGHVFYTCSYSDRLETTNQVLTNVAVTIANKKEKTDVAYIYRELKTINNKVTEEEIDKLINGNKIIAGVTWFNVIVGSVDEQTDNGTYSQTSSEQLADNFASRFGYGKYLIIGLDKMHRHYGSPEKSKALMRFLNFVTFFYFILGVGATFFFLTAGAIPIGLFVGILTFIFLRVNGEDMKSYTYDELKIRYKRIRNETIEMFKSMKMSDSKAKELLEELEYMDRTIEETYKYSIYMNSLANFLFKSASKAEKSIKEQQLLEELTFNDLFIKSKQLELAAK
jgi:hypothetical protein